MSPVLTATAVAALAGAAAVVPSAAANAAAPASASVSASSARTAHCVFTPTPDNPAAKPVHPPKAKTRAHGTVDVRIVTNHGEVRIRMDRQNAPCAVENFASLTRQKFYDHTQCWRLTNSERLGVLQCGDIYRAEEGGPGYKFDDELTGKETYPRGTVAMGNWGPDTNGSQFFIVHTHANIPAAYTVLGKVTRGMNVLDEIAAGGIIPGSGPQDGLPKHPVKIIRVTAHG